MDGMPYDTDLARVLDRLKHSDNKQARGAEFEQYVRLLLRREHFKVTVDPGGARPRQVDLMASRHDVKYLVETKWKKRKASIDDIDSLFTRLAEVESSVIGVFVSWAGFAKPAIERVEARRARPVLLVSGDELQTPDSLSRLLQRKHDHLVTDGRVVFGVDSASRRSGGASLPTGADHFVTQSGEEVPWITGGGNSGRLVFGGDLPDIDWVVAPGAGVVLDLDIPLGEGGAVSVLDELTDLGWTTTQGRWSVQQATTSWHGAGAESLATALTDWKPRYKNLDTIHHTEEFSYVDMCTEGFYSLCGEVSADKCRMERRLTMSMQLIGTPVRSDSIRHLCDLLAVEDPLFFRPRTESSVKRTRPDEHIALNVVAFVTEGTRWQEDDDEQWATGVVVENPFRHGGESAARPDGWPNMLDDSELLVCALRNWHPLSAPQKRYHLWSCESACTSDAIVIRPLADWDEDPPHKERAPRLRPMPAPEKVQKAQ